MSTAPFTTRVPVAVESKWKKNVNCALVFSGSQILTIHRDIANCSPAEMRKLLNEKIAEQGGECAICHAEFVDYTDIVADHRGARTSWKEPRPFSWWISPCDTWHGLKQPLVKLSRRRMELVFELKKEIPNEGL